MKPADPRGRSKAALTCLRCGQPGHFAVNCPMPSKSQGSSSPKGTKRAATESVAMLENAHVTFQDQTGAERPDVTMLDPGASAYLSGYGPVRRYLDFLRQQGYPVADVKFFQCRHKFHFGGDGESWAPWAVELPMCISGNHGRAQVFLLAGETPLLCGRPIIEALGITMDFEKKQLKLRNGPWRPATIGLHGEYLLGLWDPAEPVDWSKPLPLQFDLRLAPDGDLDPRPVGYEDFCKQESAFITVDDDVTAETYADGELPVPRHLLRTCDQIICEAHNELHGYVTSELHAEPKPRVIWEVYTSEGRVSKIAESLGAQVEIFGYSTGWDFDLAEHRKLFLQRLQEEVPDEVLLAPSCGPWSPMQNLNAKTLEQQESLQELREWHHAVHLKFVRKVYETQGLQGGHAHVEQPAPALSWKTTSLSKLPGFRCTFDQCHYGCECLDRDGLWKPVRKTTSLLTTKMSVYREFQLRSQGDHQHCALEGHAPGLGLRTRYMESYQPSMASILAAALMVPEVPQLNDFAGAASEEREQTGVLIKLLSGNRQEAVRTVQRLHRNLGHPPKQALIELLESRGASEVAREFHCSACERYRKPNTAAPAALPQASHFNEKLQADVMWIKLDKDKIPVVHFIDLATKYQAAAVVKAEKASNYQKALERGWFRHFGMPKELITDEGRGWLHEDMIDFLAELNILHTVAPGEAHTRLGAVERRHQVLRKAVEIYMNDRGLKDVDGLRQALAYVLPQVNSSPTVAGYSPAQWVLGYQPDFAGDLTSEGLNPSHLDGSNFEQTLEKRSAAKVALIKADQDQRLRRALLRRYSGTNLLLQPGQICWYWRDARAADLVKVRWKGPARVILREDDAEGKPIIYWIAHQTQLLRCAPQHVRADYRVASDTNIGGLEEARRVVSELKSRGVTRFVDLQRANKRHIEEVQSDEEELFDDDDGAPGPPRQRPRLDLSPHLDFVERPDLDVSPTPTTPLDDTVPAMDLEGLDLPPAGMMPGAAEPVGPPILVEDDSDAVMPPPAHVPLRPELPTADETEPSEEPSRPPSVRSPAQAPPLDPVTVAMYEPAGPNDRFRLLRQQHERHETLVLPSRSRAHRSRSRHRADPGEAEPSTSTPNPRPASAGEPHESYCQVFNVEDIQGDDLPSGWHVDSDGAFVLKDVLHDFWEVRAGCLIRRHIAPRRNTMNIHDYKDVPTSPSTLIPFGSL